MVIVCGNSRYRVVPNLEKNREHSTKYQFDEQGQNYLPA